MCSTWFLVAFTQMVQTRKTSQNVYSKWSQNNRLVIQVMKSFAMFLSRRKQFSTDPVVHLDGTTLETRPCADYLEVCIENQLSWKEQVKKVAGRACGAFRNLRRVRHSLLLHTRKLYIQSLSAAHCWVLFSSLGPKYCNSQSKTWKSSELCNTLDPWQTTLDLVWGTVKCLELAGIRREVFLAC